MSFRQGYEKNTDDYTWCVCGCRGRSVAHGECSEES